jgi:hypothetical protein
MGVARPTWYRRERSAGGDRRRTPRYPGGGRVLRFGSAPQIAAFVPPLYLFHVGCDWGFHGPLDCWPDRKEIIAAEDPVELLGLINSTGVTHLAVPAGSTDVRARPGLVLIPEWRSVAGRNPYG